MKWCRWIHQQHSFRERRLDNYVVKNGGQCLRWHPWPVYHILQSARGSCLCCPSLALQMQSLQTTPHHPFNRLFTDSCAVKCVDHTNRAPNVWHPSPTSIVSLVAFHFPMLLATRRCPITDVFGWQIILYLRRIIVTLPADIHKMCSISRMTSPVILSVV